jgi:branched-chain amino acid aminotransferase
MAFALSLYPWAYAAKYEGDGWTEDYLEQEHLSPEAEAKLDEASRTALLERRNRFPQFPLVNYTTQYGLGCFEGLKAYPWKDGSLRIFRPDENASRMAKSMTGLRMPAFPEEMFLKACVQVVGRNAALGFKPAYDPAWAKDGFVNAHAVYIRPFTFSEGGIGVNLSKHPWAIIIATPVSSYFTPGASMAVTTDRSRATPLGTGWIKCDSNYVIPALAKKEAEAAGFMEVIFLDAIEHKYVEEGSSCNIFFYLKDGTLVTPSLGDTILPGITRKSVLRLAQDLGVKTEERKITIDEAMSESKECFVTGTAAGVTPFESITHRGATSRFCKTGEMGELSRSLLMTLKGIQYGAIDDKFGWMVKV